MEKKKYVWSLNYLRPATGKLWHMHSRSIGSNKKSWKATKQDFKAYI